MSDVPDLPGPGVAIAPWTVPLPRVASMDQWLAGMAGRRKLAERVSGGRLLRRTAGSDPQKDAVLRALNGGERGPQPATMAQLEEESLRAMARLGLPLPR